VSLHVFIVKRGESVTRVIIPVLSPHAALWADITTFAKLNDKLTGMISTATEVVPAPPLMGSVPTIVKGTPLKLFVHTASVLVACCGGKLGALVVVALLLFIQAASPHESNGSMVSRAYLNGRVPVATLAGFMLSSLA
jgi:hypothetical protein